MKTKSVDYGIAYFLPRENLVEYNRKLDFKLLSEVLKHEKGHTRDKFDFWHDLNFLFNFKVQLSLTKFVLTHPSSWISFFPFMFRKGKLEVDKFNVLITTLIIMLVILI